MSTNSLLELLTVYTAVPVSVLATASGLSARSNARFSRGGAAAAAMAGRCAARAAAAAAPAMRRPSSTRAERSEPRRERWWWMKDESDSIGFGEGEGENDDDDDDDDFMGAAERGREGALGISWSSLSRGLVFFFFSFFSSFLLSCQLCVSWLWMRFLFFGEVFVLLGEGFASGADPVRNRMQNTAATWSSG